MNEQPDNEDILSMNELLLEKSPFSMTEDEQITYIKDHHLTDSTAIEKKLGVPCCYLGRLVEKQWDTPYYLYVSETAEIYLSDGYEDMTQFGKNFNHFLDLWMSRKRFVHNWDVERDV